MIKKIVPSKPFKVRDLEVPIRFLQQAGIKREEHIKPFHPSKSSGKLRFQ